MLAIGANVAVASEPVQTIGTWTGVYTREYERIEFKADKQSEIWWVDLNKSRVLLKLLDSKDGAPFWGSVRVTLSGSITGPGRYGHLGAYNRELAVSKARKAIP